MPEVPSHLLLILAARYKIPETRRLGTGAETIGTRNGTSKVVPSTRIGTSNLAGIWRWATSHFANTPVRYLWTRLYIIPRYSRMAPLTSGKEDLALSDWNWGKDASACRTLEPCILVCKLTGRAYRARDSLISILPVHSSLRRLPSVTDRPQIISHNW